MYTFTGKIKLVAIICMIVGVLGVGYSFLSTPKNVEEVKIIIALQDKSDHHTHHSQVTTDTHLHHHSDNHYEHILHQLQNKPWTAFYVAALFFLLISLGTLAFYAINIASQAGWSPVLFRVMEGITAYILPGGIIFFVLLVLSALHFNHLFVWMDDKVVVTDKLLQGKQGYLNVPFFLIRAAFYLIGWIGYRYISRKLSIQQDTSQDNRPFVKNFKWTAAFLVFFLVSESMMSWDWIMSVDPHWFSTLFGWYVFASMITSAMAVIIMITLYLKRQGYLEYVNSSHLHDLAKYMFGFSIFWTYLWFSQFLLIWYSNIPEEVTYYVTRIQDYNLLFFGMVILNFLFPLLVLVDSDMKRKGFVVSLVGFVVLIGHYIDFYVMIMPATVGNQWSIGIAEICSVLFFFGLFIYVVFASLTKAPLLPKQNPFIEESKHHH
ncbi:quinol:cytochrome C oxidoreductase [Capnocytophaga catalasegens]|uniref:Quinol:cytochrome C oxidoreductase n=1 Tax=Capnocytophaga catalasegens TaxID=1004260 RepID=A0AAV5AZX8_9FLAO|nr:quinol:cytochrome C oxidoreductase [Capnocytophaga catalasegens]GIZ14709.1 quinol:cytochrome C oxidoreductase [Capnocytophaga catalasegens]GJM50557.1 quinol:cytochrome C oxidoreductase [Capnocytophaga catalasegens]GJM53612.1 quinol:cytochrome C oxidoreductase [Capnocytophaga catalasegens]